MNQPVNKPVAPIESQAVSQAGSGSAVSGSAMPPSYLQYEKRRYGMDHDRYAWSQLHTRPHVTWPNGARVALWVIPALEWFPLDMKGKPFKPPGAMVTS